jgi:hypothetical protein
VQVGTEAKFLPRIDRVLGLRRLVSELVGGEVREVRILDARSVPLVTRVLDASGSPSDAPLPLDQLDLNLVRDSIGAGRVRSPTWSVAKCKLGSRACRARAGSMPSLPSAHGWAPQSTGSLGASRPLP